MPLDLLMVSQGAKVEAPGMPNDWFWAPKVMKISPKATQNCQKIALESSPRRADSEPKIVLKSDLETSMKKDTNFGPRDSKSYQNEVPKSP